MINEILSIINNSKMHRDQKQLHSLPTTSILLFKFSQKALFTQVFNYLSELNCPDEFSVIKGIYGAVETRCEVNYAEQGMGAGRYCSHYWKERVRPAY